MALDERTRAALRELGNALNEAISSSERVHEILQRIREDGGIKAGTSTRPLEVIVKDSQSNPNRQTLAKIWRRLPMPAATLLGPVIRRNFP